MTRLQETSEHGVSVDASGTDSALAMVEMQLEIGRAMLNGLTAVNNELLGLCQQRVEQLGDAGRRLAACRSAEEVAGIYREYVPSMISAYSMVWPQVVASFADTMGRAARHAAANGKGPRHVRAA
jgi:hypothetical protein